MNSVILKYVHNELSNTCVMINQLSKACAHPNHNHEIHDQLGNGNNEVHKRAFAIFLHTQADTAARLLLAD